MAIAYGSVYVANIAMGGSDTQTVKAFLEAEAFDGPALKVQIRLAFRSLPRRPAILEEQAPPD